MFYLKSLGGYNMSITVKQLLERVPDTKMKLLSGSEGFNRNVCWAHMVETAKIASFLEGGEITFTTGAGLHKNDDLIKLVKTLIERGASAIVLNIGPYIENIDAKIIQLCDDRQVPLFSVPWEVHMAEIIRQFCLQITLEDKRQLELSSALKNAILFPAQKELYVPHLENYGLHVNSPYTVLLFEEQTNIREIEHRVLYHQIESTISQCGWDCILTYIKPYIMLLFQGDNYTPEILSKYCLYIRESCSLLKQGEYKMGIGGPSKNMYCISKIFKQAKCVIDLGQSEKLFYNELGIYRLLAYIDDKETMQNYVNDQIGALLQYDKLSNSNLTEVLKVYLKHNGSVKNTADELYVHRNTINYKVRRIGELLGKSLTDYETCSELIVALKLHKLLDLGSGYLY